MENTIIINDMESFAEEISKVVQEKADAEVTIRKVQKNNGLELTGLIFKTEANIAPTIYLESFYDEFMAGKSLSDISDNIIKKANEYSLSEDFNVDFLTNWEEAKEYITFYLVNRKMNAEMLKTTPFIPFGDLAITFRLVINNFFVGIGSIKVLDEYLARWGKSLQDLYDAAEKNKGKIVIRSLHEVLSTYNDVEDGDNNLIERENPPMFLLTNEACHNGSYAMLDKELLSQFAKEHGDFYIIPSSIHECLLCPVSFIDEDALNDMIKEINKFHVTIEEQLSDHAYYYEADTNTLYTSSCGSEMSLSLV